MQKRHQDRLAYFNDLSEGTTRHQLPFVKDLIEFNSSTRVLEIGCGKGGNLKPFLDLGCLVTGIDIRPGSIETANELLKDHPNNNNLTLIADDIYHVDPNILGSFDFIFMKDVIEHIPNQEKFMAFVKDFLKEEGLFFLAFPPWSMPFGGHQQICKSRFLSMLPYFHLLPRFLYRGILKLFGESKITIEDLMEIRDTRISIERFEKIVRTEKYSIRKKQLYLVNPSYDVKFGLKPRKQSKIIGSIPYLCDFLSTCAYYVLKK